MTVYSHVDLRVVLALSEEREARLRRSILQVSDRHDRRSVRRWIGRRLVALGSRLANEPVMRPARAR